MGKLTKKIRVTEKNMSEIPNQSGAYLLYRESNSNPYVGSAGAGNLRKRIKQQLNTKRGITSIRYKPTSSEQEARKWEEKYRNQYNPKQKNI
jgi:excinuclease UvrABC nuclease subunit